MTMPMAPLGSKGPQISRLGFGAWAIGGGVPGVHGWRPQDDAISLRAVAEAVGAGVNWIETSPPYGKGHSEEVVGRAVRELGSRRPLVFTKCGSKPDPAGKKPFLSDLSPAFLREDCEGSLRRLRLEVIDVLQCHWMDDSTGTPLEESWGAMARLVDEGKARFIGVSNYFGPDELARCEAVRHVDVLQPPLSLLRRGEGAPGIAWARTHGTGVVVYSPMHLGALTDSFTPARVAILPGAIQTRADFAPAELAKTLEVRDALRPIARRHGVDTGAVAVAWTLAWPGVTAAAVGAYTPDEVRGWLPAATLKLTEQDHSEITAALTRINTGEGPVRQPD